MAAPCRCGTPAFFWTLVAAMVVGTIVAAVAGDTLAILAAGAVALVPLLATRFGPRKACPMPAPSTDDHERV
jgi:hypothetical protein